MNKKLIIKFSEEATDKYLEWAGNRTKLDVDSDCEPGGVTISISVCPPWGNYVYAVDGGEKIEFGEAEIMFDDEKE